ncbi:tetratricopeptide repeat protein [Actinoplanes sp. NPDC000266]
MSEPGWGRALELAAELAARGYHETGVPPPELDALLHEILSSGERPEITDVLCLADLLEEAGLSANAGAVLNFGRARYAGTVDEGRIIVTAAQHLFDNGDHRNAVELLKGARHLGARVAVSLAAVAVAVGDTALARESLAAADDATSPLIRAAVADVKAQLSGRSANAETAWQDAASAAREVPDPADLRLAGLLAGHGRFRFERAESVGDRPARREALAALETTAMIAASTLGAAHPDALRSQITADVAGFEHACALGDEQSATGAWERLKSTADLQLASFGPLHPETAVTQISVAAAGFELARVRRDAVAARKALVRLDHVRAQAERTLGARHPGTIAAEANFAIAQLELLFVRARAARDAVALARSADHLSALGRRADEVLGGSHPTSVVLRRMTQVARAMAGSGPPDTDSGGSVAVLTTVLTRTLHETAGPRPFGDHPYESVDRAAENSFRQYAASRDLAYQRGLAGNPAPAAAAFEQLLTDVVRVLGPDHPDALATRGNVAYWRGRAGDPAGAFMAWQHLFTDYRRVLGPDHLDTLTARGNLAYWRGQAGDPAGAVDALQQLLLDRSRVLGPDHPDALTTRHNLAYWRGQAGDPAGAVAAFEQLLTDVVRVLGPDHTDTLTTRRNIAYWRERMSP